AVRGRTRRGTPRRRAIRRRALPPRHFAGFGSSHRRFIRGVQGDSMSLMQQMNQRAMELGVPLAIHLDVTYRCNERCVHCYLDHNDHGEMSTAEIKDVLDQLAEAGTFFLT